MKLNRQEFHQFFGNAVRTARIARSIPLEEANERLNALLAERQQERDILMIAAYSMLSLTLRDERGLTQEQLAKRGVPLNLLRDFEAGKEPNPEFYFLYCLSAGFNLPFSEFLRRGKDLAERYADMSVDDVDTE